MVASDGSSASARAARARVAAAASSAETPVTGTTTCTPLAPLVFTAAASPLAVSAARTRWAACTTRANGAPSGGSRSRTRRVAAPLPSSTVGCSSTARWPASHSSVRRSLASG